MSKDVTIPKPLTSGATDVPNAPQGGTVDDLPAGYSRPNTSDDLPPGYSRPGVAQAPQAPAPPSTTATDRIASPQGTSTGTISAAPTGVNAWLGNAENDLLHGGQGTFIGKTLHALGANPHGLESGVSPATAQFMGSPVLGTLHAVQGVAETPQHPIAGPLKTASGALQAATIPLSFVSPEVQALQDSSMVSRIRQAALPTTEEAGKLFQPIAAAAQNTPIETGPARAIAEEAKRYADAGATMPKVLSRFLKATQAPEVPEVPEMASRGAIPGNMAAPSEALPSAVENGQPMTTPFSDTEGAARTIARDPNLPPTPGQKPPVSVAALSERPGKTILSIKVNGVRAGRMSLTPMPELGDGAVEISTSQLDKSFRGKGNGTAAYQQAIEYARSKGVKTLFSDNQVKPGAANVWDSMVQKGQAVWDTATQRYKIDLASTPPPGQMLYPEGRLFAQNAGRLSASDRLASTPNMQRLTSQFYGALRDANRSAAESIGMGKEYDAAMSKYAGAANREKLMQNLGEFAKNEVVKWAIRGGIAGAAGAGVYKATH